MSEPHIPSEPAHIPQDLAELLGSITGYIAANDFEDLIQRSIEEGWTLDQAQEHVAFKAMLVEWYLDTAGYVNPMRYALSQLKFSANEDDYEKLDPSLKIEDPVEDPPYSEDSHADNNPYTPCDSRD
jgi:hypothetical protein